MEHLKHMRSGWPAQVVGLKLRLLVPLVLQTGPIRFLDLQTVLGCDRHRAVAQVHLLYRLGYVRQHVQAPLAYTLTNRAVDELGGGRRPRPTLSDLTGSIARLDGFTTVLPGRPESGVLKELRFMQFPGSSSPTLASQWDLTMVFDVVEEGQVGSWMAAVEKQVWRRAPFLRTTYEFNAT
jgi:hypothetical protein